MNEVDIDNPPNNVSQSCAEEKPVRRVTGPSAPVPYPNPEKVDREFYDLHGIPYPQSMEKDWLESEHQDETYGSQT
jgi:hypothetical protein